MADQWVAPDTQAPQGTAPTVVAGTFAPVGPAPAAASAGEPTVPTPLRPLTVPDILDGALRSWKLATATMVGIAAVFVVPAQVALGVATRHSIGDVSISQTFGDAFTATGPDDVDTGLDGGTFLLGLVLQGLALALATGAIARLVTGWYTGRRAAFGDVVTVALRRAWALAAAWVLVHLVEGAFAIAVFVPAVVPMAWFAVTSAVVTCEDAGPLRAMRRSAALVRRRFGAVLAACLLTGLVDAVLSGSLTALGGLAVEAGVPAAWAVNTAVTSASLLVTTPFVAGVVTLLYLDLRVRTEGLDIELAASREFVP